MVRTTVDRFPRQPIWKRLSGRARNLILPSGTGEITQTWREKKKQKQWVRDKNSFINLKENDFLKDRRKDNLILRLEQVSLEMGRAEAMSTRQPIFYKSRGKTTFWKTEEKMAWLYRLEQVGSPKLEEKRRIRTVLVCVYYTVIHLWSSHSRSKQYRLCYMRVSGLS